MAVEKIDRTDASLTALLSKARDEPLILKSDGTGDYALIALDDDVIDLLLERSPKLIEECRQIRERMDRGEYLTREQVLAALDESAQT